MKIDIYFDGACKNVKSSTEEQYGYGVAVFIDDEYSEPFSRYGGGEKGTSNISEWHGCVEAMKTLHELNEAANILLTEAIHVTIYSDSQIITNQFNGAYRINEDRFLPFYKEAKEFSNIFNKDLKITWIPRHLNQKADDLSKLGLKSIREKIGLQL